MLGISTTGLPATLFLAGPTGSGKSAVAVELAEMLGAEIVGSDAYQVYRELPILTAAPSPEDRARVPHHMVSIIPARMPWDATEHYHRAMRCVKDIHARGKTAIVTGGSGLYFKFLSHGMSEAPPGDAALRAAFADCSTEELHARLASLDPEGAALTNSSNRRYVERNLEIVLAGGKPLSFWKRNWLKPPLGPGWVITREVPELDGRIALRAARMMQEGAVEEAAALGPCSATAERTLGLALIRSLLRGEITRETCQAKLALATRQYAKRQRTWLKREQWLRELPAAPSASPRELAKCIIRELEHLPPPRTVNIRKTARFFPRQTVSNIFLDALTLKGAEDYHEHNSPQLAPWHEFLLFPPFFYRHFSARPGSACACGRYSRHG